MEEIKNETKEQENSAIQLLEKEQKEGEKQPEKETEIKTKKETEIKPENEKEKIEIKTLEIAKEEEKDETSKNKSKTGIILLISVIAIIIIAILSTIFAAINIGNDKIIKGITIAQIDVSNLTKEEAQTMLNEIYSNKLESQIYLIYENFETAITYKALEVQYEINKAIEEAYNVGRTGNIFKDNIDILKTWMQGQKISVEVKLDKDMVEQVAQNINNSIEGAVIQSSYYIEDTNLVITSGKEGLKVDTVQLLNKINELISQETEIEQKINIPIVNATPDKINIEKIHKEVYKKVQDAYYTKEPFTIYPEVDGIDFDIESAKTQLLEEKEEYVIGLIITKPAKTVKEIGTEAFPDLLATFSTNYKASNVNRTTNLRLAAKKINGTVLLPNEQFSYNKVVGERTIAAGYKEAAVFSAGQVVNGLGGGICQISSTLYDAVVMANLNVTERRNHQFVTSYLPAGKDATVVWGSQDFKFINTRKYPIRITATVDKGVATIQIWGAKEEVEYDISIETKKVATIAYTTQYIEDPTLPVGQQEVIQPGSNGRKVEAYKVTKLNGQIVSTTLLSKDTYNPMKQIVRIGTGQ